MVAPMEPTFLARLPRVGRSFAFQSVGTKGGSGMNVGCIVLCAVTKCTYNHKRIRIVFEVRVSRALCETPLGARACRCDVSCEHRFIFTGWLNTTPATHCYHHNFSLDSSNRAGFASGCENRDRRFSSGFSRIADITSAPNMDERSQEPTRQQSGPRKHRLLPVGNTPWEVLSQAWYVKSCACVLVPKKLLAISNVSSTASPI